MSDFKAIKLTVIFSKDFAKQENQTRRVRKPEYLQAALKPEYLRGARKSIRKQQKEIEVIRAGMFSDEECMAFAKKYAAPYSDLKALASPERIMERYEELCKAIRDLNLVEVANYRYDTIDGTSVNEIYDAIDRFLTQNDLGSFSQEWQSLNCIYVAGSVHRVIEVPVEGPVCKNILDEVSKLYEDAFWSEFRLSMAFNGREVSCDSLQELSEFLDDEDSASEDDDAAFKTGIPKTNIEVKFNCLCDEN